MPELDLVTGAFGFTGRAIAARLLAAGRGVRTLTGHPDRPHPFGDRVEAFPYAFDRHERLARSLDGVHTLYNTYWIRFEHGDRTYERAVADTRRLFDAARRAGVERVVHVSIANPSLDSPFAYYRGKARVERDLADSGLSHAILRPTLLFGDGALLLNNIAWLLRRLPVFAVPGQGRYRVQPVHVEDLARLAVDAGAKSARLTLDAVGPEVYAFVELVRALRAAVGRRTPVVPLPGVAAYACARALGRALGDVLLTRDELRGLRAELLVARGAPTCPTRLSEWLGERGAELGRTRLSELALHYTRK